MASVGAPRPAQTTRGRALRIAGVLLALLACTALAGCGSSKKATLTTPPPTTSSATTQPMTTVTDLSSDDAPAASSGGLKPVGSIIQSGDGTTVSASIHVGPLRYGTSAAPMAAFSSCGSNFTDPSETDQDGFAEGKLTLN